MIVEGHWTKDLDPLSHRNDFNPARDYDICGQYGFRAACTFAQSDPS